jgi:hypothetical protein
LVCVTTTAQQHGIMHGLARSSRGGALRQGSSSHGMRWRLTECCKSHHCCRCWRADSTWLCTPWLCAQQQRRRYHHGSSSHGTSWPLLVIALLCVKHTVFILPLFIVARLAEGGGLGRGRSGKGPIAITVAGVKLLQVSPSWCCQQPGCRQQQQHLLEDQVQQFVLFCLWGERLAGVCSLYTSL